MELQVKFIIRLSELTDPHLVLDIPISDNNRKKKGYGGRLYTAEEVKQYRQYVAMELTTKKIWIPDPPVIIIYRTFFTSRRRDSANISKTLVDALYKQDRQAVPWPLPPRHKDVDKEAPHVDIWLVPVRGV